MSWTLCSERRSGPRRVQCLRVGKRCAIAGKNCFHQCCLAGVDRLEKGVDIADPAKARKTTLQEFLQRGKPRDSRRMAHYRQEGTEHGLANITVKCTAGLNDQIDLSPAVAAIVAATVRVTVVGNREWSAGVQLADHRAVQFVRKRR